LILIYFLTIDLLDLIISVIISLNSFFSLNYIFITNIQDCFLFFTRNSNFKNSFFSLKITLNLNFTNLSFTDEVTLLVRNRTVISIYESQWFLTFLRRQIRKLQYLDYCSKWRNFIAQTAWAIAI